MKDEEVERLDFKGWPIDDDYLVELGRITALWATLETLLNHCIGKLAGYNDNNDPTPFILVAHTSFPQRLDILGALCEQLAPAYANLKTCPAVLAKLRSAQQARNRIAHNGISPNPESGKMEIAIGSARGKLKTQVNDLRVADVRRIAMEIHLAELALYELVFQKQLDPMWQRRAAGK